MNTQSWGNRFAALVVALLLILTAWGNAWAMLIIATLVLMGGLFLFRVGNDGRKLRAAFVACAVAVGVGLVTLLR